VHPQFVGAFLRSVGAQSVLKARRPLVTRLAARLEPAARRAFLSAIATLNGQVDLDALEAALKTGEISRVEAALLLDRLPEALRAKIRPVIGAALGVGAEAGREALRGTPGFAVDFARTNPAAVAWANQHAGALVTEISASTREGVRSLVVASQAEGRPVRWLARELREVIGLHSRQVTAVERFRERLVAQGVGEEDVARRTERYAGAQLKARAETLARTETVAVTNEGQQRLWEAAADQGLLDREETRRVWIVTDDDLLEFSCEKLDGVEVGLDEPWTSDGRAITGPPLHPNCFIPDTHIVARAVRGLKAVYSGPVVTLETRRGYRLTITPNHPILTPRGWIAASSLREGDDVLSERVRYHGRLFRWAPDDQNGPAPIEQVVDALRADGLRHVEIGRDDLHGDARWAQCQVEIVGANLILRRGGHAETMQRNADRLFVTAHMRETLSTTSRRGAQLRQRSDASAGRRPRAGALALDGGPITLESEPLQRLGFALGPGAHSRRKESSAYRSPTDAQRVRDGLLGFPAVVARNERGLVNIASPRPAVSWGRANQSPLAQPTVDDSNAGMQLARDLLVGETARIQRDQVVALNRYAWHGHVYDLQTVDGFIMAEGIIASNCRCSTGLVFGESDS
jgi:hypothetical protein